MAQLAQMRMRTLTPTHQDCDSSLPLKIAWINQVTSMGRQRGTRRMQSEQEIIDGLFDQTVALRRQTMHFPTSVTSPDNHDHSARGPFNIFFFPEQDYQFPTHCSVICSVSVRSILTDRNRVKRRNKESKAQPTLTICCIKAVPLRCALLGAHELGHLVQQFL